MPANQMIGDRYRLAEQIGRGGMAAVYRAHDEQLDRAVAVKVMRADLGEDPLFVQRFEAEARRAASVSHPNVVSVYDVGTDGAPYMVMELVEGGDLATRLKRDGRMEPERATRLAVGAAAALQAAHDAGLVHRDVKPGNILLGADGQAMVADFGIARATGEDSMTKTGAMLGSVEYFSPEQARGERAGPASDIYALGVVLYEMLTGQRAFSGDSAYAVATARLRQPPPDPRTVVPDLPAELAAIVMRAMARDPARRFPSADALRLALLGWLERSDAPVVVAPTSTSAAERAPVAVAPSPSRPPGRRRRIAPAWALALLLLALIGGGYLGGRLLPGGDETRALPGIVAGSPEGAVAEATPTESPSPSPSPSSSPSPATPTPSPSPTVSPSPVPTIAATPPPAAATPVPTQVPATPAPIAAAAPADAVSAFYGHVAGGRFDQAYSLWSARMKDVYPRQGNLDGRFADTADITFQTLQAVDQTATAATVQANFTETYDSGSSRNFVGYWRLIRVDGRWLLDEPNY